MFDDPDSRLHFHDTRCTAQTKLIRQKALTTKECLLYNEYTNHFYQGEKQITTYAELQEQTESIKAAEIEAVLADTKTKIQQYGLTAEQLGFSSCSKKTSKKSKGNKEEVVMYNKCDLLWSVVARGRKPKLVTDVEAVGENLEQYRVK